MAAAPNRLYRLALLLLLAATPLPADARAAGVGQVATPPPAPPAAQSAAQGAQASEQEAKDKQEAQELLKKARKAKTPEERLELLAKATDLDPSNTIIYDEWKEAKQQVADQQNKANQKKEQAAAEKKQQEQERVDADAADAAYTVFLRTGKLADLKRAQTLVGGVLKTNKDNVIALRLQAKIQTKLRTLLVWRILGFSALGLTALIGILAGLKLRPKPVSLEITEGPQAGELLPLRKKLVVIGTMESQVDWVLDDPGHRVSRRHCEISRRGRRYFVADCSTNGTHLNGVLLHRGEPTLLRPGDEITLGGTVTIRYQ
jgi:hypothetical protein